MNYGGDSLYRLTKEKAVAYDNSHAAVVEEFYNKTPEEKEYLARLASAVFGGGDPTTPLAQVSVVSLEPQREMLRLPLATKLFRDYLETLTAGDLRRLNGRLRGARGREAVALARLLLAEDSEEALASELTPLETAHETYSLIFSRCKQFAEVRDLVNLHSMLLLSAASVNSVRLIAALTEHLPQSLYSFERIYELCDLLLGGSRSKWLTTGERADYIVGTIAALDREPERTASTLKGVAQSEAPLTLAQWSEYITAYDDYGGLPTSLWLPIIRG